MGLQDLLDAYTEIIRAATDEKIGEHLKNLLTDAKDVEIAVSAVITQAKARATIAG